jgi:hypothetical protein
MSFPRITVVINSFVALTQGWLVMFATVFNSAVDEKIEKKMFIFYLKRPPGGL